MGAGLLAVAKATLICWSVLRCLWFLLSFLTLGVWLSPLLAVLHYHPLL